VWVKKYACIDRYTFLCKSWSAVHSTIIIKTFLKGISASGKIHRIFFAPLLLILLVIIFISNNISARLFTAKKRTIDSTSFYLSNVDLFFFEQDSLLLKSKSQHTKQNHTANENTKEEFLRFKTMRDGRGTIFSSIFIMDSLVFLQFKEQDEKSFIGSRYVFFYSCFHFADVDNDEDHGQKKSHGVSFLAKLIIIFRTR